MTDTEEIKFLRQVFKNFDNETGSLNPSQFVDLVRALAVHVKDIKDVDDYTIMSVHKYYDTDNDEKLSFQEVYSWWVSSNKFKLLSGVAAKHISKANRLYSSYASGTQLTYNEFEELLEYLKLEHNELCFDEIDDNSDGLLSFREFCNWLNWV